MKAIILLSGGLDSTVILAQAVKQGRQCIALSFDYGQRHKVELKSAEKIAAYYRVPHRILSIDPSSFANSALVSSIAVPKDRSIEEISNSGVPNTYVPARNTLFLSYAVCQAEILEAQEIYVGFNAMDRNPYPDCRPEYLEAFQSLINLATKQGIEGRAPQLKAPLINLDKIGILKEGLALGAPIHLTFSCYDPSSNGAQCGHCDACMLREKAIQQLFGGRDSV